MRRRAIKLTLLRTLRGQGALVGAGKPRPVSYEIAVFEQGEDRWGQGSLQGDFAKLAKAGDTEALRLRLDDGQEIAVSLSDLDDEGATLETEKNAPALA